MREATPLGSYANALYVQGISNRWAPGCVKLGEEVALFYPLQAGERNFFISFSHNMGSGDHLLEIPCTTRLRMTQATRFTHACFTLSCLSEGILV